MFDSTPPSQRKNKIVLGRPVFFFTKNKKYILEDFILNCKIWPYIVNFLNNNLSDLKDLL